MDSCRKLQVFRFKSLVQIKTHQQTDPITDRISCTGSDPTSDLRQKFFSVLRKTFRCRQVTGRPVIYIWKKLLHFGKTGFVIFDPCHDHHMHVIFFIISVREDLQKFFCFRCLCKLSGKFTQHRCTDPYQSFLIDPRQKFTVEIPVLQILHFK